MDDGDESEYTNICVISAVVASIVQIFIARTKEPFQWRIW